MSSKKPDSIIDSPKYMPKNGSKNPQIIDISLPKMQDEMTEADYNYFKNLVLRRSQAMLVAMSSIPIDEVMKFFEDKNIDPASLTEITFSGTGLDHIKNKYHLNDADTVSQDRKIVRSGQ